MAMQVAISRLAEVGRAQKQHAQDTIDLLFTKPGDPRRDGEDADLEVLP